MGACEGRKDGATGWASACVVTNYGCRGCRGLCRGCTADGALRVPETDEEAVLRSVRLLSPYLGSLAVGGETTPEFLERAAEMVRYGGYADELAFRQEVGLLVDATTPPPTGFLPAVVADPQERLVTELEAGERKGKWAYERHGGDVAYIVNGTVYRSFEAVASGDGEPVAREALRMAVDAKGRSLCPWLDLAVG